MSSNIITIDKFYWWMSEDPILWWDWTYDYSENLDTNSRTDYITTTQAPTKKAFLSDNPISIYEAFWIILVWTDDNKIYWDSSDVAKYTATWPVKSLWIIWDILYFATYHWTGNPLQIHKIDRNNVSSSNWTGNVTENFVAWLPAVGDNSYNFQNVVSGKGAYILMWKSVLTFNTDETVEWVELWNKPLSWITYTWSSFKVFQEDGVLYLWWWLLDKASETIQLDIVIRAVIQIANVTYIIWWYNEFYSEFFALNWYTAQPINRIQLSLENKRKFQIESNLWADSITFKKWAIYIPDWWKVAFYWNKIMWMPKWESIEWTKSSSENTYQDIYWVYWRASWLYIIYYDWINYWIDFVNLWLWWNSFQKYANLVTKKYDLWDKVKEKQFKELEVRVDNVTDNNRLIVKMSVDDRAYTTIATITTTPFDWIERINLNQNTIWYFRDVSFKIEWDGNWTTWTTSIAPKLYWLTLHYDYNK